MQISIFWLVKGRKNALHQCKTFLFSASVQIADIQFLQRLGPTAATPGLPAFGKGSYGLDLQYGFVLKKQQRPKERLR